MPTDDQQEIQQAVERYNEIKALDIQSVDSDLIIEKCDSAIRLFRESDPEKVVELKKIKQSAQEQKAIKRYNEIKALDIEKTDPDFIIKECEIVIGLFGESNTEKVVELQKVKELADERKAPTFAGLLERGQKAILYPIVRTLPKWVRVTLSILAVAAVPLYGFRNYIPRPFYFEFIPDCPIPIENKQAAAIDHICGIDGERSRDQTQLAINRAENNFCASTKEARDRTFQPLPARDVTYQQLVDRLLKDSSTSKNLPDHSKQENRPGSLQEGEYVSYVAFVKNALYSDTNTGEPANCNRTGNDYNDLRVVLAKDPKDDECQSTFAEVSPHFRPLSWTQENLNILKDRVIRVKGQLFFDGNQKTCSDDSRVIPKRASLWEIHPVYSLEVCDEATLDKCRSPNTQWTRLECYFSSGKCM